MANLKKGATAVFAFVIFIVSLSIFLEADITPCRWNDVEKIIAVGDIHGDYDNFVRILRKAGIVDGQLNWAAGNTHFVQIGDVMDRGDCARDALDLIRKLEKQADQAGGKVHFILGNHEEMNITGIAFRQPGYVTPKQLVSFLPEAFRSKREKQFRQEFENSRRQGANSDPGAMAAFLEKKWAALMKDPAVRKLYVDTFNDDYGRWMLEHNVVIKINDVIFCHGGISQRFSTWPLEKINQTYRFELDIYRICFKKSVEPDINLTILYEADSPTWNRDIALKDEEAYGSVMDQILDNLDAKYMIIAHTPVASPVIPEDQDDEVKLRSRFNQRVWVIDTGISDSYHGVMSFLRIENGRFFMKSWADEEPEEEISGEPSTAVKDETREDVESFLSKAEIVKVKKEAVPGRTAAWEIDLDDGQSLRRAFFKPIDDRRPGLLPESYKYELAAYTLAGLLDFDRIPPMVEREIEGLKGSLQIRLENCLGLDEQKIKKIAPPDSKAFAEALEEINIFENLVYSERKELDDILIDRASWDVHRVDFSEAFSPSPELIPGQKITRCSVKLFENLQGLSDRLIEKRLATYLNGQEMSALLKRKAAIIKTIRDLIAKKGKEAVLF